MKEGIGVRYWRRMENEVGENFEIIIGKRLEQFFHQTKIQIQYFIGQYIQK